MKEYLDTAKCYKYVKDTAKRSEDWIKIPSGAEIAFKNIYGSGISFTTEDWMTDFSDGYKIPRSVKIGDQYKSGVVWRRHIQPEELPFVDDGDDDKCDSKLGNFVVDDTLSQRQSQYGEFKDVANTTQYLLQMLSNDKMSDVQLESLHMICSKLARIAHGDPNHVDSWHDIAGYATLVVKDIS